MIRKIFKLSLFVVLVLAVGSGVTAASSLAGRDGDGRTAQVVSLGAVNFEPADAPTTGQAVRQDKSPPLKDLVPLPPQRGIANRQIRLRVPLDLADRSKPSPGREDPVRQSDARPTSGASTTPGSITNFEGLSDDNNAALLGFRVVPPDTEGDVGRNYYIQMVNLIFAIYDKSTGSIVPGGGPFANNQLWQGFGGICESNNDGDPIVLYDHLAGRWVFSQFAIGNDGHQCIAVSASGDPTGSYYRYDFVVSQRAFNDYPKLGLWPDAYYMTANEFGRRGFRGAIAVAFERDAMLSGDPNARFAKFGPLKCGNECFYSLQPSHLEGPGPAAGTPNTFLMAFDDQTWGMGTNADGYRLWDFAVDWANDLFSFTELGQVNTPGFDANLCNFSACVPQPGVNDRLDTLSQFTMYRAQFRHFATHDSIVVNHTVDADGNDLAGIRWAELRNDGTGWALHQTGTYAPGDGDHRWMGSIAMDGAGNIALGYTVSSGSTFPSVRYVTRAAGDPPGELSGGEVELIAGTGSQQGSSNRWGDYSTMSVDPVDDCTFWYTQEYYANTGSYDFKTRIGSFRLDSCGSPVTDVAVTAISALSSVVQGETVNVDVTVSNVGNQDVTSDINVTLNDDTDNAPIGSQTISGGLTAGASTALTFSWDTSGASTGDHTLTASHDFADDDASNDSKSTVVTVESLLTDIAVAAVDAPTPVVQGDVVSVNVTVENVGNQDVTSDINVTLTDNTDRATIGTETISGGLMAGASTTLTYSWDTGGASTGDHTLTASHDFADDDASNDSKSTGVTVNEPTAAVTIATINPNTMGAGTTIDVTIAGSGFVAGASVTFENGDGPAPTASNVSLVDATTITATVTAKPGGPPRDRVWDVRVTNPDGSSGVLAGGFTITP